MNLWDKMRKNWFWMVLNVILAIYLVFQFQNNQNLGRSLEIAGVGRELEGSGDIQGAFEKYQQAVKVNPNFPYGLALLGRAYDKMGKDEEALSQYNKALEKSPHHFWVHYLIGRLYRKQGRYPDAIDKFEELIVMKDNWYKSNMILENTQYQQLAHTELGYCYGKIGDTQRAIKSYERYLELNPSANNRKEIEEYLERVKSQ